MENNETVTKIFRNSGKDYNDLGRFEDCLNLTGYRYILASVPKAFPIPMSLGMCVPDICTVQDFNNFKSYLVSMINLVIPELFEGLKGFDLSLQLNTDDLHFEDSQQKNDEVTKADATSWLVVLFIFFFTLTVVICSLAEWYFKKENQKKQNERRQKLANRAQKKKQKRASVNVDNDDRDKSLDRSMSSSNDGGDGSGKRKKKKVKTETKMERVIKCFSI